jgi:uncharacterized protein
MADEHDEVAVRDDPAQHRFEVRVGEVVAGFVTYRASGDTLALLHTQVDPAFEGRGLGSVLARGALDAAAERGLGVLPYCPFVRAFIERHPEYVASVPASRRSEFGLDAVT